MLARPLTSLGGGKIILKMRYIKNSSWVFTYYLRRITSCSYFAEV